MSGHGHVTPNPDGSRARSTRETVETIVSDLLAAAERVFKAHPYVKGSADDGALGPIELDEALAEMARPFEDRLVALIHAGAISIETSHE